MARPVKNAEPALKPIYYRNGVRESDDVSYDGMEITSPVLAALMLRVRKHLENNQSPQELHIS